MTHSFGRWKQLSLFGWIALTVLLAGWQQVPGYELAPPADWVQPVSFDEAGMVPENQISSGVYYLLIDSQTRVQGATHETFTHTVLRVVNEKGITRAAQLSADYDPAYQTFTLHQVRVHRNGQVFDQRTPDKISVLQRETQLEYQIYDGAQTVNVILDDVRVGDIVEYSYTIRGANPIFEGTYADHFQTQWSLPVHRLEYRLLWPAERALYLTTHNTDLKPTRTPRAGYTEYRWTARELPALMLDSDLPVWYDPYPWIQLSETSTWADVAQWGHALFADPAPLSAGIKAQVEMLARDHATAEERILAALRFTQEEIRYMGFEMGSGSHKPRDPSLVLRQRFGDCKDKTWLLITLLDQLGIEARPALVHSRLRHTLDAWHPTPLAFNHVIARVTLGGRHYWLDPTDSYQRGSLDNLQQSDFGAALILHPATTALEEIPSPIRSGPQREILETFDLGAGIGEAAEYTVQTTYTGSNADWTRSMMASQSRDELAKSYINFYARVYPSITVSDTMTVEDDTSANVMVVTEHYSIPDLWEIEDDMRQAAMYPLEMDGLISKPSTMLRTMPLALSHPTHLRQTTRVMLPESWPVEPDELHIDDEFITFDYTVAYDDDTITVTYEYQTKADHVPASDVPDYLANLDRIQEVLGYQLFHQDEPELGSLAAELNWPMLLLGLMTLGLAVFLALKVYRYEPSSSPLPEAARDPKLQGISGWLILPAIGIIIKPIALVAVIAGVVPSYAVSTWATLTDPSSLAYHPLWAPVLIFELAWNLAALVFSVLLIVLFFQKRYSFPKVFIYFMMATIAATMLDQVFIYAIPAAKASITPGDTAGFIRDTISMTVWVFYFHHSKRVESTFVEQRFVPEEATPELAPAV